MVATRLYFVCQYIHYYKQNYIKIVLIWRNAFLYVRLDRKVEYKIFKM